MDNSTDIFRQPARSRLSLRDLVGPLLGVLGAAALLAGIVYAILWLTSVDSY